MNKKKKRNRIVGLMLCLGMLLVLVLPACMGTTRLQAQNQVIRVGYYQSHNFQEGMSDEEMKSGYSYEYLQNIANYTGWTYEYVYGDWTKLYEMLLKGEIDLLAGISYTDERASQMLFPNACMGVESYYIYKKVSDTDIVVGNNISLRDKRIGAIRDNLMTTQLERWLDANHVAAEVVLYDSFAQRDQALNRGEIDAVVGANNNMGLDADFSPVAMVGSSEFYLAVSKKSEGILMNLNQAQVKIKENDPYFLDHLQNKYFQQTSVNATLSTDERNWLATHSKLRVGYIADYMPFSGTDEDGNATGVVRDAMEQICEKLGVSDTIDVIYQEYPNAIDATIALQNDQVDAVFPVYSNLWNSEQNQMIESSEVVPITVSLIYEGKEANTDRIAISDHSPMQKLYAQIYYPDSEIVYVGSAAECLKAIQSGKASCTLFTSFRAEFYCKKQAYRELSTIQLQNVCSLCIAVRRGNTSLLSLINRGIHLMDQDAMVNTMYQYVTDSYSYTLLDFIVNHLVFVMTLVLLIFAVIIVAFVIYVRYSKKYERAKEEAAYDALTDIRNRGEFMRLQQIYEQAGRDYALVLIDADNFKTINDTYGHTIGDQILIKIADAMKKTFRTIDAPCRIGGDEFAVIMTDVKSQMADVVQARLIQLQRFIALENDDLPKVTVSMGVAFSDRKNPTGTIFEDADDALYRIKQTGRNGFGFYRKNDK